MHRAMRFVDNTGKPTESYPHNPNGSPDGLTAVTTADGRFTVLMPHPERVFRNVLMSWTSGDDRRGVRGCGCLGMRGGGWGSFGLGWPAFDLLVLYAFASRAARLSARWQHRLFSFVPARLHKEPVRVHLSW
jgi:hypothetical protein